MLYIKGILQNRFNKQILLIMMMLLILLTFTSCSKKTDEKIDTTKIVASEINLETIAETTSEVIPTNENLSDEEKILNNWNMLEPYSRSLGMTIVDLAKVEKDLSVFYLSEKIQIVKGNELGQLYFTKSVIEGGYCTAVSIGSSIKFKENEGFTVDFMADLYGTLYVENPSPYFGKVGYEYNFDNYSVTFNFDDKGVLCEGIKGIIFEVKENKDTLTDSFGIDPYQYTRLDLSILKQVKWNSVNAEFNYLGQSMYNFLARNREDWEIKRYNKSWSDIFLRNVKTNVLVGTLGDRVCRQVCIPNNQVFDMNEEIITMKEVSEYWKVPFEWSLVDPTGGYKLWSTDEKSFYFFDFGTIWMTVSADKEGNVHAEDYTDISLPYHLGND